MKPLEILTTLSKATFLSYWLLISCNSSPKPRSPKISDNFQSEIDFQEADDLRYQQDYDQAAIAYQELLNQEAFNTLDSIYALNQIAYCNLIINKVEGIKEKLTLVEELIESITNPPKALVTDHYFNQGRYHFLQQDIKIALEYVHQASRSFSQIYPQGHLKIAQSLTLLSLIHLPDGITTDSMHYYSLQANDFYLNHPELKAYDWENDYSMGFYSLYTRAHEQGTYYSRAVLQKLETLPFENTWLEVRTTKLLANMIKKQADAFVDEDMEALQKRKQSYYQTADSLFRAAIAIAEMREDWDLVSFYSEWVINASRFTDSSYFFQTINQFREKCAELPNGMVHYNRLLGYYYYYRDTDKAIEYYNKALENINSNFHVDYWIYADIYYCLRNAYQKVGMFDLATYYAEQSLLLYNCTSSKIDLADINAIQLLDTTKNVCLTLSGFFARDILQRFQEVQNPKDLVLANTYFEFVDQHSFKSLLHKDEDSFLSFQKEAGRRIYVKAIEAAKAAWLQSNDYYWLDKVFNYMEHLKSYLLYRDMLKKEATDTDAYTLSDSIRILQGRVNQMLFSVNNNDPSTLTNLKDNNLVNKLRQLEIRRTQNADNFELNILQEDIKLSKIKQQLNAKSGLVSYMNTDNQLIGIYLDQDTTILFSQKQKEDYLKNASRDFRNSIEKEVRLNQTTFDTYLSTAHELYQTLVQPFESRLADIDQLIVIPDEQLGNLTFEAFLTESNTADKLNFRTLPYLLRQVQIVYTSSWKVFQNNQNRIASNFQHQSIGFWTTPELKASNGLEQIEQMIEKGFGDYQVFSQSKRGKELFSQHHKDFDILHLLLHASSSKSNRYDNQIRFGASKEDLLYGFDLYQEKFNANLLVLASCESASGTARKGEGTFSLARSFINSGVPEVLAAQFLIPQTTTAPLLSYFYQSLAEGKDAAMALHEAKLAYLENIPNERYTYPRFWAGIVLYR